MTTWCKFLGGSLALTLIAASWGSASAENNQDAWSQWRGPTRNGQTNDNAGLTSWPKVSLKKLWEKKLGAGYSAVSVADGRAYTMGRRGAEDTVHCFEMSTGKELWSYSYRSRNFTMMNAGGPSCTPSIVDGRVYTISRSAQAFCFDAQSGKILWKKDFRKTAGAKVPTWGFSGSALVKGDRVYIDVGVIVALDRKTGKRVWGTRNYGSGYSSPVAFKFKGKELLATFPAKGLVILEEGSGKEIAVYPWRTNYNVNAATPLILKGGSEIFISSGYNTGCALVKFDGSSLKELWRNRNMRNQMASSVHHKGYIYGFDESQLKCLDLKTGAVIWKKRGLGKGSLILVEDMLVVLGDRGILELAKANPKGYNSVKSKQVLNGSGCWTAPVLTQQHLYIRNPKTGRVVCFQVGQLKEKSAPAPKSTPKSTPGKRKFF
ncbi:MAG: PQQ-like beta-propeller repeat protein [Planctomycetota bacterium]|nr:PQQ-like beta-propeller repeat protein [Planctomycetota bacterium]